MKYLIIQLYLLILSQLGLSKKVHLEVKCGKKYLKSDDERKVSEVGITDGDDLFVKILKDGSENIPGYVTANDLYVALGNKMNDLYNTPSKNINNYNKPIEKNEKNENKVENNENNEKKFSINLNNETVPTNKFAVNLGNESKSKFSINLNEEEKPKVQNKFAINLNNTEEEKPKVQNKFMIKFQIVYLIDNCNIITQKAFLNI